MPLQRAKEQMIKLLGQENNSVIALSGRWGTGKTHLWTNVKAMSSDDKVKKSLYVSLFGLSSVDQIKRKLMESAIPGTEENGDLFDGIKNLYRVGVKAASEHYKGLAALNDLNVLLMAPIVLREKVIVIDDLERKHEKLGIDEVLGFIDEFTAKHSTRFLLILNTDKLGDRTIWEKFREKVIHHEIALEITPDEAFDIANAKNPSTYATEIKRANQVIGVSNIRVLLKAITFIETLFKNHLDLEAKVRERFVPAAFLLCAIHYQVLPDGPTDDYVLSFNSLVETEESHQKNGAEKPQTWPDLMYRLGLIRSDQFELEVASALRTGLMEYAELDGVITTYQRSWQAQDATKRVRDFAHDCTWDHKKSDKDLFREAKGMLGIVKHMDVDSISALCSSVFGIDQPDIANTLVQQWLATHRFTPEEAGNILSAARNEHFHPAIVEHLRLTAEQTPHLNRDLAAVTQRISRQLFLDEDERAILASNVGQYVQVLKSLNKQEFIDFVRMHMDWVHFGKNFPYKVAGGRNFVEACVRIIEEGPHTRLARILRRKVFNDATADLLNSVHGADAS